MKSLRIVFLLIIFSQQAHAEPHIGIRAQSFGGADRARASSNDTIFYNPAGIIKNRRFGPDFDYLWETQSNAHRVGASIVDSITGDWGLGIAYNGRFVAGKKSPHSHLLYLSAAMPIVSDIFVLGCSFHYTHDRGLGPEPYANFFNMNAGLLVNLPLGLSFAVVADNLIKAKGREKDLGLALGTAFDLGILMPILPLSFSFDWLMDDVKSTKDLHHIIMSGMQYSILGLIPLRLGYTSNLSIKHKLISIGTGVTTGIFALDGLYQQNIAVGKERSFGIAMRLNF